MSAENLVRAPRPASNLKHTPNSEPVAIPRQDAAMPWLTHLLALIKALVADRSRLALENVALRAAEQASQDATQTKDQLRWLARAVIQSAQFAASAADYAATLYAWHVGKALVEKSTFPEGAQTESGAAYLDRLEKIRGTRTTNGSVWPNFTSRNSKPLHKDCSAALYGMSWKTGNALNWRRTKFGTPHDYNRNAGEGTEREA